MPRLSLAIAVRGRCDARELWERLAAWPKLDAHFVCDDDVVQAGKPDWVDIHRCEAGSIFEHWGTAIAHCEGDYVAVLSPYLIPERGWLAAMNAAASSNDRAYFGPVEETYEPPEQGIIGYLVEYGHFHRPLRSDNLEIPGTNLLVKASELPSREELLRDGFTKTALMKVWTAEGYHPTYVENAVVIHDRPYDPVAYRSRRFLHGRAYGVSCRKGMGLLDIVLALAKDVLLPFVRVWRIWARVRHVPSLKQAARGHLWAMLRAETAWSAGEFAGLATGDAGAPELLD